MLNGDKVDKHFETWVIPAAKGVTESVTIANLAVPPAKVTLEWAPKLIVRVASVREGDLLAGMIRNPMRSVGITVRVTCIDVGNQPVPICIYP